MLRRRRPDGAQERERVRLLEGHDQEEQPGDTRNDEAVQQEDDLERLLNLGNTGGGIGRVVVSDAAADFADLSLPLPFKAQIAALNGEISTIATTSLSKLPLWRRIVSRVRPVTR